jgi:threonine/homoserine/homoserine lactone efflux protein
MPDAGTIALFLLAAISLNLTPGPDTFYVLARSIGQGRNGGIVSALGLGLGYLVHTGAAALGLSALLRASALAYDVVKYAGAAYLVYLGVRAILTKGTPLVHGEGARRASSLQVFRQGTLTSVLNPKVALFFLAFLPQFVHASNGPAVGQFILFGALFTMTATTWHIVLAFAAGSAGNWLRTRPRLVRGQQVFTGGVMIALGLRIALPERI